MPLTGKLSPYKKDCKGKKPTCPHCGWKGCWGHGRFFRKGFHRSPQALPNLTQAVPRFLCQSPRCGRSFSRLPAGVIPYQRFFWRDFLTIADRDAQGVDPEEIAFDLESSVSSSVVKRTLDRLRLLLPWIKNLCWELAGQAAGGLRGMARAVLRTLDWPKFTGLWFRRLYPARFS